MKQVIDCTTGEIVEREFNEQELLQAELDAEMVAASKVKQEELAAAKQAVLDKLGLTEDELKVVIG